ncbi:MAG: UDP-N-acetylglucosamine 2-epimerase (hydrolyzing) [Crocinitomicaceae bacterium]|nr:UDP-N-acetylglucosamine 2-epimerase (hydrolyzing) [Crocinitomicaceae bacterium]
MHKVIVLTSSRADYGIYRPLLKLLAASNEIDLGIIAFGAHLFQSHGQTVNAIKNEGYSILHEVNHEPINDSPQGISFNLGEVIQKFSSIWGKEKDTNLIICLGDRYEMFGAIIASIPFQLKIAHIHGGETTLGAIDNIFRHGISLSSSLHFVATQAFQARLQGLVNRDQNIFTVGALSLDNINEVDLLSVKEFEKQFDLLIDNQTILCTFHPETINLEANKKFIENFSLLCDFYTDLRFAVGLPNADTDGSYLRESYLRLENTLDRVSCFEHLGTQGYFSAMKNCKLLLGNTSSGIIEAASFEKYVINVGDRQKGRVNSDNVFNTSLDFQDMKNALEMAISKGKFEGENEYKKDNNMTVAEEVYNEIINYLSD